MRPHEKLDLWKKAIEFVVEIYRVTEEFPRMKSSGSLHNYGEHQYLLSPMLRKERRADQQRNSGSFCFIHRAQQTRWTLNWSSRTAWRILRTLTMSA
jgi:hypothetical protein